MESNSKMIIAWSFLKKHWLLALIIFAVIAAIAYFFFRSKQPTVQPPATAQIGQYKNLQPGKTTIEEAKNQLGQPISITQSGNLLIYKYPSRFANYPSDIFFTNDKIVYIREPVRFEEKRNIGDYLNDFGQADTKLYSPNLGPEIPGYIYLSRGVAVFAHNADGVIIEVWYFEPTTLENFKKTWGKDLVAQYYNHPE